MVFTMSLSLVGLVFIIIAKVYNKKNDTTNINRYNTDNINNYLNYNSDNNNINITNNNNNDTVSSYLS